MAVLKAFSLAYNFFRFLRSPQVASIESIKANDYNLNIPRYVDTFEAEDAIDLGAISAQLIELDKTSQATDATIATFCKELGIEPPFAVQGHSA